MIVSIDWLQQYVTLDMPVETLTDRLTMAGLNLEGITQVGGDTGIDLEVTSNRPDCLGHLGVAREISVLFNEALKIPPAQPETISEKTSAVTSVDVACADLCPLYVAHVIRGVKIGPSPEWLVRRLETLGITAINNVVDVTNYVLMESGQPLHAFDFDKLHGGRIVVRRAEPGEKIAAIDQREYELHPSMCVIADADHPVAIGGVMGGLETEIGDGTVNVLVEAADFAPLSIRTTARTLNLHSDSSYRFERGVDAAQIDWASRRCCELILEIAGGELLNEPVIAGTQPTEKRQPIALRFQQIPRLLGIEIPPDEATQILTSLGLEQSRPPQNGLAEFMPPSWRGDLTREIDLIEEVARIHGYDRIPANVHVPLQLSSRTQHDRVCERVRELLTAAGFFEAITLSFVSEAECDLFTPRGTLPKVKVEHSSRRRENVLRQSLIPSLLKSRRENERHGTSGAQLFEIAKVYLRAASGEAERQVEPMMVGIVSGRPFSEVKGIVEALAHHLNHAAAVLARPCAVSQFVEGRCAELTLDGKFWGWLGELPRTLTDQLGLREAVTVAELDLAVLEESADLNPLARPLPQFPAVDRDLNFVLDEAVTWQQLEDVVHESAGSLLEEVWFGDQYRGKQIAAGKKSYVATLSYRAPDRTLTAEEVDAAQRAIIDACGKKLGATLR